MKLAAWLAPSMYRQFPHASPGKAKTLDLFAARGERVSFQVGLRLTEADYLNVSVKVAAPAGVASRVRRVGCVPVPHFNMMTPIDELDGVGQIPGFVPDVLWPEDKGRISRLEVSSFWVTLDVSSGAKAGVKKIEVEIELPEKRKIKLRATLHVAAVVLQKRRDFPVTHWFYADAIAQWYKVPPYTEAFWPLCEKFMRNYAGHGLDTIYVPVFTPPLDGVKRASQLLGVKMSGRTSGGGEKAKFTFDWSNVKRWIRLAQKCGIDRFEWCHLFTQWGVKYALRIYRDNEDANSLLWPAETAATSAIYRNFLAQFLPELKKFLDREGLMEKSYFHVSDEPHGEEHLANYRAARAVLTELAPWMRVMDALSEIDYGRQRVTDMPIPHVGVTKAFVDEGIDCWTYFCCGQRQRLLNRLMDTPLAKARMAGWLFYRFGCKGFLHWGYNYWFKSQTQQLIDPFTVSDGAAWPGWTYGDPFEVYPGPAEVGPIDSMRWEVFHESLQDYALLQTLGIERSSKLLAPLRDFDAFPKDGKWVSETRRKLLR